MATTTQTVTWIKDDPPGMEFAEVVLSDDSLSAVGVAIGSSPVPYRLDYQLDTRPGFGTARLQCVCTGDGWSRKLELRRRESGVWLIDVDSEGEPELSPPGGSADALDGATDCDLGLSPLTNTLPVLRTGMRTSGGSFEIVAAWVSVPDLVVAPDRQRYTVQRADSSEAVIRYEAVDGSFMADITFDPHGLVLDYPGIARRVAGGPSGGVRWRTTRDSRDTKENAVPKREAIDLPYMRHGNPFPIGSKIGNIVVSGAIHCVDEKLGATPEEPEAQVAAMFTNIRNFMAAAGGSTADILKIRLLVKESKYSAYINKEWVEMFPDEATRPTRKIDVPTQLHGGFFAAEVFAVLQD